MSEEQLHGWLVWGELASAVFTLGALWVVVAPSGRHGRAGWGPEVSARSGWILMEAPAVLSFGAVWAMGSAVGGTVPRLLLGVWMAHYLHRALVFPFRMRSQGKRMPLVIATLGAGFNMLNGYVNARAVSEFGAQPAAWLASPSLWIGLAIFGVGLALNLHSDTVLLRLRAPGQTGYRIPFGGGYSWVSCPNYLGEMLEWLGWALACGTLAGWAFFAYTVANLFPRALAHHRWYRETFAEYPRERRAVLPYLW